MTRRTWVGALCALVGLSLVTTQAKETRLLPGRLEVIKGTPLPLRAMVSMPLAEYDELKADAAAYRLLKENLNKEKDELYPEYKKVPMHMVVTLLPNGSVVPPIED